VRKVTPLTMSLTSIGIGCIVVLVWAYRSGGFELLIAAFATVLIACGVGSMQVVFNAAGRKKTVPRSTNTQVVVKESEEPKA
jgi:hypothetical protein